jgi:hypothetical protein
LFRQGGGLGVSAVIAALGCVPALGCSADSPAAAGEAGLEADGPVARDSIASTFNDCPVVDAPTYAPTYTAVYCEIVSVTCAVAFCHSGLEFLTITSKEQGYSALVNAPAMGPACGQSGLKLVDPGHSETSLLYLKITNPPCGARMPLLYGDASGMLDPLAIEQVRGWIAAGAQND